MFLWVYLFVCELILFLDLKSTKGKDFDLLTESSTVPYEG